MTLTTHVDLLPRLSVAELYLQFPICPHGVVLIKHTDNFTFTSPHGLALGSQPSISRCCFHQEKSCRGINLVSRGLLEVLLRHLPVGIEERQRKPWPLSRRKLEQKTSVTLLEKTTPACTAPLLLRGEAWRGEPRTRLRPVCRPFTVSFLSQLLP